MKIQSHILEIILPLPVILFFFLRAEWNSAWYIDLLSKNQYNIQFLVSMIFFLGYLFYRLRQGQQYWYGLVEALVVIGICLSYIAINGDKNIPGSITAIIVGILSFSRALTNIGEGALKNWAGSRHINNALNQFFSFLKK